MSKTVTITFNEEGDNLSLDGIPADVWARFKENAKRDFPKAGEDAWAHYLSEIIMGQGGGTKDTKTVFMTDIPTENVEALDGILRQTGRSWDEFHAYLLMAAVRPGQIRLVNMVDPGKANYGTFIATGLKPEVFANIDKSTGIDFEKVMAAIFDGASQGTISIQGTIPDYAKQPMP